MQLTMSSDSASCFNSTDGTAQVSVSGGTPFGNGTYQYAWNATGNPTSALLSNILPGMYVVTVTDANGCTQENNVVIGAPEEISIALTIENITCAGLNDGSVVADVTGGTAPYSFEWNDPASSSTSNIFQFSSRSLYTICDRWTWLY